MPSPANNTDQPKFININQLERNNGTDDIITSMKSGGSGTKSLVVRKIVPVGNSVQTYQVGMYCVELLCCRIHPLAIKANIVRFTIFINTVLFKFQFNYKDFKTEDA